MKKFMLSILVTFALCAVTAIAQTGAPGTQRSSPTTGSPNAQQQQQQPGMSQPGQDQTSPTAQTDQNTPNANHTETTGKTLKGCVESQSGQYVLETKKGSIPLMGQDVSAHVGHEVKVKGTWEKASAAGSSTSTESNSGAMSGKSFNVSSVDMVSENCKIKGKSSSTSTGTGTGTGAGTSNQPQ